MDQASLKEAIKARYGEAARAARGEDANGSCCGGKKDMISRDLYEAVELEGVPSKAVLASLGCGNPTALAELHPGETVLDLGSGGGIDVLLSARRVGPTGKAYGLDMTDEMLALARENQAKAGATNVEFLKGEIEQIPLPADAVDVIISNCVINLSAEKDQVFREAFRVLRPGGRFAVSDVVFQGDLSLIPPAILKQVANWTGCLAGALEERDYIARLEAAGFTDVSIEVTRVYGGLPVGDKCCGGTDAAEAPVEGIRLVSGFVRARKPQSV